MCNDRVQFSFDTNAVSGFSQPNDTTLLLTFSNSWQGKIKATTGSCDQFSDSINLVVSAPLNDFSIGPDIFYCPGDTQILTPSPPGFFKDYTWHNGSKGSAFTATAPGRYYLLATDFCDRAYSDSAELKPVALSFSAGTDTTICQSESIVLQATPGFTNYSWSPPYHISGLSDMTATVFPDVTTTYIVQAQHYEGCFVADTILVTVKNCPQHFYVPDAFTPNNDGKNEIFKPVISGVLNHYELNVYNRWGQLVFRTTNRDAGWNGLVNGNKGNNGVYTWICRYRFSNQPAQVRKGTVVLIR